MDDADMTDAEGTGGDGQPRRRVTGGRVSVLVVFSGDARASSTLAGELRPRGAEVTTIDTAVGG
eukprot:5916914-Pleurochrysis_carterae.AAC.1